MELSPATFCSLFLVIIALVLIGVQGARMKILLKMGLRNVNRRKVNTLIVVLGLMIGTTIISGSLVVGDTLENMFTKDIYDSYDETDEIIITFDETGNFEFFNHSENDSEYDDLNEFIQNDKSISEKIEGVSPEIHYGVSAFDTESQLSEARITIIGFDYSVSREFGKLYPLHGPAVTGDELGPGEVYVNEQMADEMDIEDGHHLIIFYGENLSTVFTVKQVVETRGRAAYGAMFGSGGMNVLMPLDRVQTLLNQTGKINIMKVSNTGGKRSGMEHSDDVEDALQPYLYTRDPILLLFKSKQEIVENAETGSESLQNLFMVLGTFSIIAGMMLIINIFVMLAEERKSEMGMARAVGMSQKQLMYMFLFEGTVYSVLSSAVGTVAGMGVAFLIILAFGSIFGGFNSLQFFTFTAESLVLAFIGGMLITLFTIFLASRKVSRMNIIRAIRNIPEPRYQRHEMTEIIDTMSGITSFRIRLHDNILRHYEIVLMVISAFLVFAAFVDIGIFFNREWAGYGGLAGFIYGVGLLLRRYVPDEQAFTIAGGVVLILWCYPYDFYDQLFGINMKGGMEMFVLSGLFMVSSALMVIMYNSNLILSGLMKIFGRFKSLAPIFKTAISYPMDNRFRTGMTLAMFSLIIFTVTVLAMIMGLIQGNIDQITDENSGGYDMIGFNDAERPITDVELAIEENVNLSSDHYSKIVPLYTAYTAMYPVGQSKDQELIDKRIQNNLTIPFVDYQDNATWYNLIGCSEKFFENSDYELDTWDEDEYEDYENAWKAIQQNSSLAIGDRSIMVRDYEEGGPPEEQAFELEVGDTLVIRDMNNNSKVVTIIGFTKQSIIRGIFVLSDVVTAEEGFNTTVTSMTLFKFRDDISESRQEDLAKDLEREFLPHGMQSFIIRKEIKDQLEMISNFFYLLEAFLGLGLIVGIAGLGIITIRSVAERRQQIGMLRAIGFKRNMIWKSFLIESSYIALLGIFIGVALGIILGLRFWLDPESGFEGGFTVPWNTILVVSIISYVFTFICTIGPSKGAAKIVPAEALRYVG